MRIARMLGVRIPGRAAVAAAAVLSLAACSRAGGLQEERLLERIRSSSAKNANAWLRLETAPESVPVEGADTPGQMRVALRTPAIEKFPCTRCHDRPLAQLVVRPAAGEKAGKKKAHWNITLKHAGSATMNCATCHGSGTMNELVTLTGGKIGMDHAHRVCGQCHATQWKDWAGGAHGKRLSGWAPPRVAASCAACHDPHQPALASRWPAQREPWRD